ncbi:Pal1 cell morphology protein-domain-containing protein [Pisolithus microcarpus]|nr:Pal1 cell morphology protein-domain-containing protein [Pisolithus microcarpus]
MSRQPVPPGNKPSKVVHPLQRARHRSYSDPFSDPVYATSKPVPRLPPDPPQKHPQYNPKVFAPPKPILHRDNMADALRDTVQFRPSDQPSRSRTGRSQTALPSSTNAARPSRGRRSQSQDSALHAPNIMEKPRSKPHGKKGSMHADVIDRLDFTGVGPMFHHDGPFDACAPSRNRHRTKAPILAWSSNPAEEYALAPSGPYPSPDAYNGGFAPIYDAPKKNVDAIAEAWGIHEPEPYEEFFAGGGATRRDGGTPSSSIYGGREGHFSRNATPQHSIGRRSKDGRDLREVYREYLDDDTRQAQSRDKDRRAKRGVLPPPQPILVPEAYHSDAEGGQVSPSGQPKRTKSLMQRFRKLRENPNIPADGQFTDPPSPTRDIQATARPTHRSQNSFLGRLAQGSGERSDRRGYTKENTSPISDGSEAFVYIDDPRREKRLPATPHTPTATRPPSGEERYGYFDATSTSPGYGGANLGRRASLLKKVKDVVRGPK